MRLILKLLLAVSLSSLLTACAVRGLQATTTTIGEPEIGVKGATFEVLALDFDKAVSTDFLALRAGVIQELSKKSMIPVNGFKVEPRYLVLFDYAVDIGVQTPYESRFVAVTHDIKLGRIVHRISVTSKGVSSNVAEVFPPIVRHVYSDFPASGGFKTVTIPE
jgi:hypothetical protein